MLSVLISITILGINVAKAWSNPCNSTNVSSLPFCDTSLSFQERAHDLVYTQERKQSNYLLIYQGLTSNGAHPVPALNIPKYNWWNEALHGLARGSKGHVTQFPQVITTGATFNESLFFMIGDAISTEGRALHNQHKDGLTFWAPNINIFRDPRWGRGQETPGEDPFLTERYAAGFVKGMQGSDNKYLKTSSCCKHFADYSMEKQRTSWNDIVSEYDQNDTYLVAFRSCVVYANASGIMCSYNAENGIPSCANKELLTNYLIDELGFIGYITSDCGAVGDVQNSHHYTNNSDATINAVFSAGMDLDCGGFTTENNNTANAVKNGAISLELLQNAIYELTLIQMRLGMFDNSEMLPWYNYGPANVTSNKSLRISYDAARQGQVLLKNVNKALPLDASETKSIALIGPNANNTVVMEGNYYGSPPFIYSVFDGLKEYISNVNYEEGCSMATDNKTGFEAAINAAKTADVTIMVMGLDQTQEKEAKDRSNLLLPGVQYELIEQVSAAAKGKTILVLLSGGCVDVSNQTFNDNINAIIWSGYPGMYGGLAIADVIFGTFNPTGRISQTFYYNNYTLIETKENMNMRPNSTNGTWYG
eukprot:486022_1